MTLLDQLCPCDDGCDSCHQTGLLQGTALAVWIIVKASRIPRRASTSHAYSGPTARIAGVEPSKIYDTREEAQRDAVRLASWNRCGFVVVEVED